MFFACLPVWSVEQYFNQDGSPHLYNAYIIQELLRSNPAFTEIYSINPAPLPNLSGHYLLAFLLFFFSPAVVTKIIVTLTFAGLVAAVVWLRTQVCGREDLNISAMLGAALAFNWMWFLGFYNFIIGVIGFAFTLGLYWRWREQLDLRRCLVLAGLLIVVFFSHLISFAMLAGSLLLLSVFVAPAKLKQTVARTAAIILPVLPLIVWYKLLSQKGGGLSPVWEYLANPAAISNWVMHLQTADPFQLLSRKAFPFFNGTSVAFTVFSPFLWIFLALLCLSLITLYRRRADGVFSRQSLPFLLIFFSSVIFWIFAPDNFGKAHGSFLRERVLLCGLICFVPLFRAENSRFFKGAAMACLGFVIVFQTAVLWQYARNADQSGREFLAGQAAVGNGDSLGSIILIEDGCRYKSSPLANLPVLYGIGKDTRMWDNYELGFYLFPTVAKNAADSRFIYDFREAATFDLCDPNERLDEKFARLDSILDSNNDKITVMLVWGDNERVSPLLKKWYEEQPFFQSGRVRLFRHR